MLAQPKKELIKKKSCHLRMNLNAHCHNCLRLFKKYFNAMRLIGIVDDPLNTLTERASNSEALRSEFLQPLFFENSATLSNSLQKTKPLASWATSRSRLVSRQRKCTESQDAHPPKAVFYPKRRCSNPSPIPSSSTCGLVRSTVAEASFKGLVRTKECLGLK